jgi:hypothetical protein
MKNQIIRLARVIDYSETTCRVRLLGSDGLPTGQVLTDVPLVCELDAGLLALVKEHAALFPKLPDQELDTMARQNVLYNSHRPVVIE